MQLKCFENLPVEGRRRFICSNFSSFFSVQFPQFILGEFVKNTFDPSVVIKVLSQSRSESLLVLMVFIASVEKLCSCPAESLNFISHKLLISNTNKMDSYFRYSNMFNYLLLHIHTYVGEEKSITIFQPFELFSNDVAKHES